VNRTIAPIDTLPKALPFALLFFLAMIGVGRLSFLLIEQPFMRLRRPYLGPAVQPSASHAAADFTAVSGIGRITAPSA
jgi:peptidoglycan/LPS O-acetylase OafA/YrhL